MQNNEYALDELFTSIKLEEIENMKQDKKADEHSLPAEIKKTVNELQSIREYFECVSDPELVEYAIYREKSIVVRLSYLIRIAKENNIKKHPY